MNLAASEVNKCTHRNLVIDADETTKSVALPQTLMPRVLVFAFTFPPCAAAGTFRTLRFVRYLPSYGWQPLVLSARTEIFPEIPIDPNLNEWIPADTIIERTTVLRPINQLTNIIRRLLGRSDAGQGHSRLASSSELSHERLGGLGRDVRSALRRTMEMFAIPDRQIGWSVPALVAGLRMIRKHRPSVLYSSGPPHSSHLVALLVKRFSRLPLVLDFRDPWAHCDWDSGNSRLGRGLHTRMERFCVSRADMVILNTESLCRQFRNNYPAKWHNKFVAITNGYDPELRSQIEGLLVDVQAKGDRKATDEFLLCHAGAVYGERRLEPLVAAIALLNRRGHQIVLEQIGRIADRDKLERAIAEHQAGPYVKLISHRPHDEVMRRMAEADAHVLLQPGTSIQIPGKLFEMMMFGKPIFAIAGPGETTNLIRKYGLGVSIESEDPTTLAAQLEQLSAAGPRAPAKAAALSDFDGQRLTGKLADVFETATSNS